MSLLRRRGAAGKGPVAQEPAEESLLASCVAIAGAPARRRIRVHGQIVRMRARPISGVPALSITISDDTGSVTAIWTGRRAIGGVSLGRHLVIEGVGCRVGDRLEFTNPTYTLLP